MFRQRILRGIARIIGRGFTFRVLRQITHYCQNDADANMRTNGEEAAILHWMPASGNVLDIGACHGEWTDLVQKHRPGVRVHLFEPNPESMARLKAKYSQTPFVLNQSGVSDQRGRAVLHVYSNPETCTLVTNSPPGNSDEEVQITTIDEYCADRDIAHLGFVKIDVEGLEVKVLSGASRMLNAHAIDCVQFEYGATWIGARAFLLDAFELLQQHGYRVFKYYARSGFVEHAYHSQLERMVYSNYVAVGPHLTPPYERQLLVSEGQLPYPS